MSTAHTFSATGTELREIIAVLDSARRSLVRELNVEERKPINTRLSEAEMDRRLAKVVLLGRVVRELSASHSPPA